MYIPDWIPFEIVPRPWPSHACVKCQSPAPYVDGMRCPEGPKWYYCFQCGTTTEVVFETRQLPSGVTVTEKNASADPDYPIYPPSSNPLDSITDTGYLELRSLKNTEPYRAYH